MGGDLFEREQVLELAFLVRAGILAQFDKFRFLARQPVSDAVGLESEIVRCFGLKGHFLQGRDALVAPGKRQFQSRRAVLQRVDGKMGRELVRAAGIVLELQFVLPALIERELKAIYVGLIGVGHQIDRGFVLRHEPGCGDRFVEEKCVFENRTFDRANAAGVGDGLLGQAGVTRKREFRVRPLEVGIIEDRDLEIARLRSGELDVVAQVAGHLGNTAAEDGVVEVFCQRNTPLRFIERLEDQGGFAREFSAEPRQHDQPAAALDARVTRGDGHATGERAEK